MRGKKKKKKKNDATTYPDKPVSGIASHCRGVF